MDSNLKLSRDLEMDILSEGIGIQPYINKATDIVQEIRAGLKVGERYILLTKHGVTDQIRGEMRELKRVLHSTLGDNGSKYRVNVENDPMRQGIVELSIRRAK